MGSAKEPETLQLLNQEAVPEDAAQPSPSSPCSQEKDSCLQNIRCDRDLTMRNCCVNDLGTNVGSQDDTMVDNPNQKEKAPTVEAKPSMELAAATDIVVLKDAGTGGTTLEGEGEIAAHHDLRHNSKQGMSLKDLPSTCNPLESKASPVAGEATCSHLPAEPCLKGANKDPSSAPASLKHVAFLEPTKKKVESESIRAGTVHSKAGLTLPSCLQNVSQGQLDASKGDTSHFGSDVCEAGNLLSEGCGDLLASAATKASIHVGAKATPGKSGRLVTEMDQLGHSGEARFPALETNMGGGSNIVPGILAATVPHEVKHQGVSGESQTTPGEVANETAALREATPSSLKDQNRAQEQQKPGAASTAMNEECILDVKMRSGELVAKTCSFEVTPPQQDAGTQADNRVSLVSVAVSPINPPDGSAAFTFHARGLGASSLKSPGPEQKPAKKDVEMQVSIPVETRSVATGPMTPVTKSPQASYPEVHVKGAQEETPEPVREVSWDEKGMTWEVYGASMEVEVLGMAIQKHLEKQIEEHGRQMVMTPQSTRASSIKGAPHKGEIKRQPSVFRALLQNMRRPRCCSRGGPAVE
ncbi:G protein-regulated inducer of neurite outgrowth 1 [Rhineura floridana]|uniref:G protein-regulated inducer of neurite outgrowth 1 n=1 Tax=Rhineura floridana TaxID=261503 RepID=UPI002AC84B28|nr:G protein-regulated inducer of neurite outgrowth 1 [Rhineura floridana]